MVRRNMYVTRVSWAGFLVGTTFAAKVTHARPVDDGEKAPTASHQQFLLQWDCCGKGWMDMGGCRAQKDGMPPGSRGGKGGGGKGGSFRFAPPPPFGSSGGGKGGGGKGGPGSGAFSDTEARTHDP